MGWFDEQIRSRIKRDDEVLSDGFLKIAGAIMGKRLALSAEDDSVRAKNAREDILKYYHIKMGELPPELKDINEQIDYLLRPQGMMRRPVTLQKKWYRNASGPMLGRRTDTGSVTSLIPGKLGGYTFFDETTGERVRIHAANEGLIDSEAMAFYVSFPLKKLTARELIKYIAGLIEASDLLRFIAATLAVTLVGLLIPQLSRKLFSDGIESGSVRIVLSLSVFMVCSLLSGLMISTVKRLVGTRLNMKVSHAVEATTMMRILSLPAQVFRKYSSGDLASRAAQMSAVCSVLVNTVLSTSLTGIFSLLYIGQIISFAAPLARPSLFVLVLTLLISVITSIWRMQVSAVRMELEAKESGMNFALISGIRKIRLAGAEKRAFARWCESYAKMADATYNPPAFIKLNGVLITAVNLFGTVAIYYTALKSGIGTADYMAFNSAFGMVSGAFTALAGITAAVADIRPTLEECKPILETVPELSGGRKIVTRLSGGIELNNVTFRYSENGPAILDNLSLKIRPGQYVAIVGRTGCGKSTLMRIMLGFETPEKGAVYYDGRNLSTLETSSLRRKIGTVMQDGKLMQGDIYSNIVVSAPWLTLDDAWEAAEKAGMAEDIRNMPMGMFTLISEGLGGISGGQRQRLMIARAIAPKPKILIFDEATSALDNLTQKKVSESLDALKCTRIVVAHRLSTIRQCDRIIVLDKGRIIEDGKYEELIARNGFFADLVARQRLDTNQT